MPLEYVTALVNLFVFDPIGVTVLNHGAKSERVRMRIHRATATGSENLVDSGDMEVLANRTAEISLAVNIAGDYWVQINAESDFLIPCAKFTIKGTTMVNYFPGDFAVFESGRRRN